MASVPFIPPTPPPPSTSVYAPFNRTLDLAHNLGVRPSTETLKILEVAEIEKAQDPHPKKRARVLPRGKRMGLEARITPASMDIVRSALAPPKGKGKSVNRDEEVSLGGTEDNEIEEVDPDSPMGDGNFKESAQYVNLFSNDQTCHRASFSRSLLFFFTSFSLPSTQLPHPRSHFTRS